MKEIKLAIRHKETKKWVKLWYGIMSESYVHMMDNFNSDILYSSRNILEEDLEYARWCDFRGRVDPDEFEILEIEITYNIN